MKQKRRPDYEATEHATRTRLGAHPIHFIPPPTTVPPHTHHARDIIFDPFGLLAADDVQEALEEHDEEKLARSGVQPMLGSLNMNTFDVYDIGQLRFDQDTAAAAVDGGLQWADDEGIERLVMTAAGDAGDVDMPVGGVYVKAKNASGDAIPAGAAVVIVAADGNLLTMEMADLDSMALNDRVALGVTMQASADTEKAWVCRLGYLGGIDCSGYTAGLHLYVSGLGTMSGAVPQKGCAARIRMGVVITASDPGSMWVDPDWRPDLDELANVAIGEYAPKQHFDVPMWLPRPDGEPCDAWRDVPASRFPVTEITDGYDVDIKDVVILVRANGGDVSVTLPDIGDDLLDHRNRWVRIKKISGAFKVIVNSYGGLEIDGETSVSLVKVGEVLDVQAVDAGGFRWEIQ